MKIRYFAWLKKITNISSEEINNKNIIDVDSLKKFLCKKYPNIKEYLIDEKIIRIAINLEYTSDNDTLSDKDEIALFPPVSGG